MTTNEIRGNIQVIDDTITESKLNIINPPASGHFLQWNGISLQWAAPITSARYLYYHEESSGISTYNSLFQFPANDVEDVDVGGSSSSVETLIEGYITDEVGVSIIPGGIWRFLTWAKVGNTSGNTTIIHKVYKRDTSGTETLLFQVETTSIESTTPVQTDTTYVTTDFVVDITDRLLVKIYCKSTSAAPITTSFYHEGNVHYSYIITPFTSGTETFIALQDTPDTYVGYANYVPIISPTEDGLIYLKTAKTGIDSHLLQTDDDGKITIIGINVNTTGAGNGEIVVSGKADIGGVLRVNNSNDFVAGSGIEFAYVNPQGYITAYDRSAGAYRQLNIRGNPVVFPTGDIYTAAWTSYSATSTIVGWASFTTKELYYKKIGKLVYVAFQLFGTSDSTAITFTLPYNSGSTVAIDVPLRGMDNGSWLNQCLLELNSGSNTASCYPGFGGGTWTATGTKRVAGQFFYEAA